METVQVTPLRRTLASSPYSKFASCLQGFDTVGWAAGSTSGPQKNMGGGEFKYLGSVISVTGLKDFENRQHLAKLWVQVQCTFFSLILGNGPVFCALTTNTIMLYRIYDNARTMAKQNNKDVE